jgi:hypothetical protein
MSYDAYLLTLSQLAEKKKARVVVQGSVIFIETLQGKKKWNLSAKVFDHDGLLPKTVKECLSSTGILKWQERGAYLKLDSNTNAVYLIHEIESSAKYVPFKYRVNDFAQVANEWKEILDDFAERDHIPIRVS